MAIDPDGLIASRRTGGLACFSDQRRCAQCSISTSLFLRTYRKFQLNPSWDVYVLPSHSCGIMDKPWSPRCSSLLLPLYLPSFFLSRIGSIQHSHCSSIFDIYLGCAHRYVRQLHDVPFWSLLVFRSLGLLLCFHGRTRTYLHAKRNPHYEYGQAVHRRSPSSTLSTRVERRCLCSFAFCLHTRTSSPIARIEELSAATNSLSAAVVYTQMQTANGAVVRALPALLCIYDVTCVFCFLVLLEQM